MGAKSCDLVIVTKLTVNPSSSLDRSSVTPRFLSPGQRVVLNALAMTCSSRGCPGVTVRIEASWRMEVVPSSLGNADARRFLRWGTVDDSFPIRCGGGRGTCVTLVGNRPRVGLADGTRAAPVPYRRWACATCSESMTRPEPPCTTAPCGLNVGCHTDAHEQVQWFGDDISFKATKYMDSKSKLDEVTWNAADARRRSATVASPAGWPSPSCSAATLLWRP